jgi:hypothetical protein
MSYPMMENDYGAPYNVGVVVKDELLEATATVTSKKKEKRRGRSSNGMGQLGSTSSADDKGESLDGEVINSAGRTYDYVSLPAVNSSAGAEKKSKKKCKRDNLSNSNVNDGIPEGILKSSMLQYPAFTMWI